MIYIEVFNAAGKTKGLPEFETTPSIGAIGQDEVTNYSEIESGRFKDEQLSERWEGKFQINSEPFKASVDSYEVGLAEDFTTTQLLYQMTFEDPIKFSPYWNTNRFFRNVESYAESGVEFEGNRYKNVYSGTDSDDHLSGNAGNDVLRGKDGRDILNGGEGKDQLYGGEGKDVYIVDNSGDRVIEKAKAGVDQIRSYVDFTLPDNVEKLWMINDDETDDLPNRGVGNELDNKLRGSQLDDVLVGRGGDDNITGYYGEDRLVGGLGTDTLRGGKSSDVFEFRSAQETVRGKDRDVIVDFAVGNDTIKLSKIDANVNLSGNQAFEFIGTERFSGSAGELRSKGKIVAGDVDGDGVSDFQIENAKGMTLSVDDFIL